MFKLPQNKSYLIFIGIAIISTLLWMIDDYTLSFLRYDAQSVRNGEIWRFITGHIVHSNGWHLLLNLASLLLIGVLFSEHLSAHWWILVFIISAFIVSACYYWIAPQFNYYVGLSAVLYGVIIIGALLDLKTHPWTGAIVLVVVTGRVIWQQTSGTVDSLAELIEDRVAIESHLFGICSGYGIGLLLLIRQHLTIKAKIDASE